MTLIHPSGPQDQPRSAVMKSYRSDAELRMRVEIEAWGRARWPEARVVHELVVDRGAARADMAFIGTDHFVAVEIKSAHDYTDRLMMQAATFRLMAPELWLAVAPCHMRDTEMVRYLLPSIGLLRVQVEPPDRPAEMDVDAEAVRFEPHPAAMLSVLWVAELLAEARRFRVVTDNRKKPPSHAWLVGAMTRLMSSGEQMQAVCRQLRARNAMWRADPPIIEGSEA